MPYKIIKRLILNAFENLRHKGTAFYLNIIILFILIFLIKSLFDHESSQPFLFGYSPYYLLYLGFLNVFLIVFFILILCKGRIFNRNILLAILFVFLALELALRFHGGNKPYRENIYRFPKPYVMFTGEPKGRQFIVDIMGKSNKRVWITLNELGFRVKKQLPKQKTNDELRIFVLGGSAVFNGTPLSNSIPGQLEQLFHHDGYENVKVYNFGVVSYVSGQELALLLHTVSDYQPDTVIIYGGGNDIFQPYYYDPRPGYPYNFMLYEVGITRVKRSVPIEKLFYSILNKSILLNAIFRYSFTSELVPIDLIRKNYNYKTEEWESLIVTEYINNLDKMCKLAKSFDFKLVVFLQPMIYFKSTYIGNEKDELGEEAFQNYIERQYERTRMLLKDLNIKYANEDKCSFVDLSYAMQDYDKETFWDYIHIDNEGNKVIATKIYDYMKHKKILKLK